MGFANLWKQSFNGGELTPRVGARTDQVKYAAGASKMENFLPTVQGPIIRRGGTYFTEPVKNMSNRTWLLPFLYNQTNSYTLEFGDKYIRFYTNRGVVSDVTKNITAIAQANPAVITSTAHGFSNGDTVQLNAIVGMTMLNSHFYTVDNATTNTFTLIDIFGATVNSLAYSAYISGGTASRIYQIATPYNVADLTDNKGRCTLTFAQSNAVLYMASTTGLYPLQQLSRFGNTNWTMVQSPIKNGPFQPINSDQTQNVYVTPTSTTISGAADNGAGLVRLTVGATTGLANGNTVEINAVGGTIEANGVWAISIFDATHIDLIGSKFANAYTSGGTLLGGEGTAISIISNSPIFADVGADELFYIGSPITDNLPQWNVGIAVTQGARYQSGVNTYVALNSATTGGNTPIHTQGARYDGAQASAGVQWLYEDSGYGVIQLSAIASDTNASGFVQVMTPNSVTGNATPSYFWAHGIFGSKQGYPEVVTLFRDRLGMIKGIQLTGSVSDDFLNFSPKIGGIVTADSSFVITLPTANQSMWMNAQNDLQIGTTGEELLVNEIDSSKAIGPSNIKARRQTSHGSVRCDSVPIEFVNMFANKSGQQLRQQVYSWQILGYLAKDMTLFGEHIPKGPDGKQGIVQMAWAQDPDALLWNNTTDGRLCCFTYHSEQEVIAWHNHPLGGSCANAPLAEKGYTNAVIESVCAIPSPDGTCDDLWLIVRRTINGQDVRYVEYMQQYFTDVPQNQADAYYVDCGLTYTGTPAKQVFGYDHLKGQTVDVLVNGGTHPQVMVANDGSVTLQSKPSGDSMTLQIGLHCPARFISMKPEGGTQAGTAQILKKKISSLGLRLLNSLGIRYGDPQQDETSFNDINFRTVTDAMDKPPPIFNGDKGVPGSNDINFGGDWNGDGLIEILCDKPLPCTIVGMRASIQVTEQ